MSRSVVAAFGVALVAVFGPFAIVLASGERLLALVPALANVLVGVLLVVGGLVDDVSVGSRRVRWFHLVGAAVALHGATWLAYGARSLLALDAGVLSSGAAVYAASGLAFLWIGVDFLRGGIHHDLSVLE